MNLSPVVFVGLALIVAGLIAAIIANIQVEKKGKNSRLAYAALYAAVLVLLLGIALVALSVVMPLINPTNGWFCADLQLV